MVRVLRFSCAASFCGTLASLLLLGACGWNPLGGKDEYVRRGQAYAAQGKLDEASLQYRKALQKDDRYGEACLLYGRLLNEQNKTAEAVYYLGRAVELMPGSIEAATALGRAAVSLLLSDPSHPKGPYESSVHMADFLLSRDPNSAEGFRLKGYLAAADLHSAEAISYFRKSIASNPNQPDVSTMLVQTLILDNQRPEAETVATEALRSQKTYSPLYDVLYGSLLGAERYAEAEKLLLSKIANNPRVGLFVIQLAGFYADQNRINDVGDLLRKFVSDSANYPDAPLLAGDFYALRGSFSDAVNLYRLGVDRRDDHRKEYFQKIVSAYLAQGEAERASSAVEELLREYPGDVGALASRADLRMATGKPEEMEKAIAELSALVQKKPDDSDLTYSLGRAYRQIGREKEAENAFLKVLQLDSGHRSTLREMADMKIRQRDPVEALKYADQLVELDPDNTGARLVRTSAWALTARQPEARAELRRITSEQPELIEPWLQLATLNVDERKYSEAEQIFQRMFAQAPTDIRALRGLVLVYTQQRRFNDAIALLKKESVRSGNPQLLTLLASTAADAGDSATAGAIASKLAADYPQNIDHLLFLGDMHQRSGQNDKAIETFREAAAKAPWNPLPPAHLADVLAQTGHHDEAVAAARQSLKLRPDDATYMNVLAWQLVLAGQSLPEAAALVDAALQAEPGNPAYLDTAALVDLKMGRLEEADRKLTELIDREPANVSFRIHYAEVLLARGNRSRARTQLKMAESGASSLSDLGEIRRLLKTMS